MKKNEQEEKENQKTIADVNKSKESSLKEFFYVKKNILILTVVIFLLALSVIVFLNKDKLFYSNKIESVNLNNVRKNIKIKKMMTDSADFDLSSGDIVEISYNESTYKFKLRSISKKDAQFTLLENSYTVSLGKTLSLDIDNNNLPI